MYPDVQLKEETMRWPLTNIIFNINSEDEKSIPWKPEAKSIFYSSMEPCSIQNVSVPHVTYLRNMYNLWADSLNGNIAFNWKKWYYSIFPFLLLYISSVYL